MSIDFVHSFKKFFLMKNSYKKKSTVFDLCVISDSVVSWKADLKVSGLTVFTVLLIIDNHNFWSKSYFYCHILHIALSYYLPIIWRNIFFMTMLTKASLLLQ